MYKYEIKRSARKTLSMEIKNDLTVLVRVPRNCSQTTIEQFVNQHHNWIEKQIKITKEKKNSPMQRSLTQKEASELKEKAKRNLPKRVAYFSELMEVKPNAVKITSAQTRFGSCSAKNNICFSFRLMLYSAEEIDCVIVHELAHIIHKNHGQHFYAFILRFMPDYKEIEKRTKQKM